MQQSPILRGKLELARVARRLPMFRGKGRLLSSLDRLARRLDGSSLQAGVDGVRFQLDTSDIIDFGLLYMGGLESSVVSHAVNFLKSRGSAVVWDVGANVGSVSLPIARQCPLARVVSFEPSPTVRARFETNLALNPELAERVEVHPLALSDSTGHSEFFVSCESFNSGVGGLGPAHNRVDDALLVETARGDDLIAEGRAPAPDYIKIDVEGSEYEVLMGLKKRLESAPSPVVVFEHSPYRLEAANRPFEQNCTLLRELGYELQVFTESGPRPLQSVDLARDVDIIAQR